jgi:uncharacterized protein with PIN domain
MPYEVTIRFYEELNFFLSQDKKQREYSISYLHQRSIKDLIEAQGVPHVEVDLILVNGNSVGFDYLVQNGDRVSVYPVFERLDIGELTKLQNRPLRDPRFVLDVHLHKLAKKMRLFGFDVDYAKERDDHVLAQISQEQRRILLTRDRHLLMRGNVSHGLYVRNIEPQKQIIEILGRLDLFGDINPFTRCLICNNLIRPLPREDMPDDLWRQIPLGVSQWCREYYFCPRCRKVYWQGSHYERLQAFIKRLVQDYQ